MSDERYPRDIKITPDDFRKCRWREIIDSAERDGYVAMWRALSSAASRAIAENRKTEGKILWLFADACSMMLDPASPNNPFRPLLVLDKKRSVLPEDFEHDDIEFFAQIVEEIDDPWLQARISDLIWLVRQPRDPKFALIAIDAYRRIPLNAKTWVQDGGKCWKRAIFLCKLLGKGAGNRLQELERALFTALNAAQPEDGFFALWLADVMLETGLGQSKQIEIANKLEALAIRFDKTGELHQAQKYYDAATKWYRELGDDHKSAEMTAYLAEALAKEASTRMSSDSPSHIAGMILLENAIQTYRRIPRKIRPHFNADERIQELYKRKQEAGEKSVEEMARMATSPIDITELVENSRRAVSGLRLPNALAAFASIYQATSVDKLRSIAIDILRSHPLLSLFPATVVSKDGRVVAKRPAISFDEQGSQEAEKAIWAEMIKLYNIEIGLAVQAMIWPALETLLLEHRLLEPDLIVVAEHSPVVPNGREKLVGKGLFAGFERDFVTATHLLVPQIEHMVRWHLKMRSVKTTILNTNGVENEMGLSSLLDLADVNDILGKDLAFELRALFTDPFGPNLRNECAHGLLEYDAAQSVYTIYAWWFSFRLVFISFLNRNGEEHTERIGKEDKHE